MLGASADGAQRARLRGKVKRQMSRRPQKRVPLTLYAPSSSSEILLETNVLKKGQRTGEWQARRLMLTKDELLWTHVDSDAVLDKIPLHQVERISADRTSAGLDGASLARGSTARPQGSAKSLISGGAALGSSASFRLAKSAFSVSTEDLNTSFKADQEGISSMCGWVWKRGAWNRAWKKRWFVLEGGVLSYYKSEMSEETQASLSLEGLKIEPACGEADGPDGPLLCFAMTPSDDPVNRPHVRRILCGCESMDDREMWIKGLQDGASLEEEFDSSEHGSGVHTQLLIKTMADGYNQGISACFRMLEPEHLREWKCRLDNACAEAEKRQQTRVVIDWWQQILRHNFESALARNACAFVICCNFLVDAVDCQMQPEHGTSSAHTFMIFEYLFTFFFTFELLWNAGAYWMWEFILDIWNFLDCIVVLGSVISLMLGISNVKAIRLVRTLRILRLIRYLKSLRKILTALGMAVFPVLSACLVVWMVICIYAVVGVGIFSESYPQYFGNLQKSLFMLFSTMTMEGWVDLTVDMMGGDLSLLNDAKNVVTVIYFISFIIVVGYVLVSVVIAVLLENFSIAAARVDQEELKQQYEDKSGPLDCLLEYILGIATTADLSMPTKQIFEMLDTDDSEKLTFQELRQGLDKLGLNRGCHMTHEYWDDVTMGLLEDGDRDGGLNLRGFQRMVYREIREMIARKIRLAACVNGDGHIGLLMQGMNQILRDLSFTRGDGANHGSEPEDRRGGSGGLKTENSTTCEESRLQALEGQVGTLMSKIDALSNLTVQLYNNFAVLDRQKTVCPKQREHLDQTYSCQDTSESHTSESMASPRHRQAQPILVADLLYVTKPDAGALPQHTDSEA